MVDSPTKHLGNGSQAVISRVTGYFGVDPGHFSTIAEVSKSQFGLSAELFPPIFVLRCSRCHATLSH